VQARLDPLVAGGRHVFAHEIGAYGHEILPVALARPSEDQLSKPGRRAGELVPRVVYLRISRVGWALLSALRPDVIALALRLCRGNLKRVIPLLARGASVARHARRFRANILYAHWPRPSEVGLVASAIANIPLGISIHAHEVAHDNHHFPIAFPRIAFAAFCNAAAMRFLLDRLPTAYAEKARLIYHGVDFSQFQTKPLPVEGVFRIASAGRLTKTKGFDRLLRGVAELRASGRNVELVIYGEGGCRVELARLAEELEIADVVSLPGWVAHEVMADHLENAHAFALLADIDFNDGLPNVVLEALAMGRPAIVSPLPAAGEAIIHGENGFILRGVDDIEGFVEAFTPLIDDRCLLERQALMAAKTVRRDHDRHLQLDRLCAEFGRAAMPDSPACHSDAVIGTIPIDKQGNTGI